MVYPIIMNGDHAEFEREHANTPPHERPDWPLPSFDARDWAAAFCKVVKEKGFDPVKDEDWAVGWFANALMRGFDEHAARTAKLNLDVRCEVGCVLRRINANLRKENEVGPDGPLATGK